MGSRRQLGHAPVKALHSCLQHAYRKDDVRLVRRTTGLLDLLVHQVPGAMWCERWGLSPSGLSAWQKAFGLRGLDSLVSHPGGGRRPKLTARQTKRWVELIEAGPLVGGLETAWGPAVRLRVLSWRELSVLYQRHDVWTWRHPLGVSFPTARLVSDHLDAAKRVAWLRDKGPAIVRVAKPCTGLILVAAEASFAQWGSLRDTWSRRGHQPEVPTSGKRKGYKGLGALEYFSGRLFSQGIAGRLNSERYQGVWHRLMAQTTAHLLVIHDGARSHTSAAPQALLAAHRERITEHPWPSYSPDDNPLAYLWKQTTQRATHNKYFKEFVELTGSVEKALAYFATHPETVLGLFGRYCEENGLELQQAA